MTKSDRFTRTNFMITDTYRTFFALRNMSAFLTNDSTRISFFIDENSDFFSFFEMLLYAHLHNFRKIRIELFGHIHEKYILVFVLKFFVIHKLNCKKSVIRIKMNFIPKISRFLPLMLHNL